MQAAKRPKRVTMKDVADAAGVSHSTVSRVLTGNVAVHTDTEAAVRKAVDDLGYTEHSRHTYKQNPKRVITLVVVDFQSLYITNLVDLFDKAMVKANYSMIVATARGQLSNPREYIDKVIKHNLSDGFVLIVPGVNDGFREHADSHRLPFVLLDQPKTFDVNTVSADNIHGTRLGLKHLATHGHQRIGFITGMKNSSGVDKRLATFNAACVEFGFDTDSELIVEGDYLAMWGYRATEKLIALDKPPTAIFANSDLAAGGAIAACKDHGLEVPEDISIMGFDDLAVAKWVRPSLTTIRQPFEQMAIRTVELLGRRIERPNEPVEQIVLGTELVIRDSTGPARSGKLRRNKT